MKMWTTESLVCVVWCRFLSLSQKSCMSSTLTLSSSWKACQFSCRWSFLFLLSGCGLFHKRKSLTYMFTVETLIIYLNVDLPGTRRRPPPSRLSSSPTPASSRVPGRLSSGSTCSVKTPRWEIVVINTHTSSIVQSNSPLLLWDGNLKYIFWMCSCLSRTSSSLATVLQPHGHSLERCWAGSFSLPLNLVWMILSWKWSLTNSLVNPVSIFGSLFWLFLWLSWIHSSVCETWNQETPRADFCHMYDVIQHPFLLYCR